MESTTVRGQIFFGLYSESDCTVTLTVERIGDSEEIPKPELVRVSAPTSLTRWSDKAAGETLTLMPVTGAYTAVLGEDGYYHVNSATGPTLMVMLTRPVSRYIPEASIKDYPTYDKNERKETVLHFNPTDINEYFNKDKRYPLKKYDYNAVLAEYSKWVNKDGLYGVDEKMYELLTNLASTGTGIEFASAADGCQWLLPCYYYEPAGGLSAPGSGTEADPYIISTGVNTLAMTAGLNGTAKLKLSVASAGVYSFKTSGKLTVTGYNTTTVNGVLYVLIPEAGDVAITLDGTATSYKLELERGDDVKAFVGSGDEEDNTPSEGLDEATAIGIIGTGVWHVIDDKAINDGVYIKFACDIGGAGTYTLTLYGDDDATLNCGSATGTTITINAETDDYLLGIEYGVYIKASSTASLMLIITKQQ